MEATAERPRPPADAYGVMERLLGPSWFIANANEPKGCHTLSVVGRDNLPTYWRIPPHMLGRVKQYLTQRGTRWSDLGE